MCYYHAVIGDVFGRLMEKMLHRTLKPIRRHVLNLSVIKLYMPISMHI